MIRFPGRPLAAVTALFLIVALPTATPAQAGWAVDLSAGRAVYDPVSSAVGANNLSLGLQYYGSPGWLYLSGGTPLGSEGARWWATGLGARSTTRVDAFSLGADLGAHLFGYEDLTSALSGTGATLEAAPLLRTRQGPVTLELGSGVIHYLNRGDTSVARTVYNSGLTISLDADIPLMLSAEARYLRAPEGGFSYAGGSAEYNYGGATLWAAAGTWLSDDIPLAAVGGGITLGLDDRTALRVSWQQEPTDPVYWSSPRRSWSVGLTRALGAPIAAPPPLLPTQGDGQVTIRIPVETSSSAPFILGDFTGWEPVPMRRDGDFWIVELPVEPGIYYYGFQHPDGEWFIPPSIPHQVDDGMGGTTAVLVVA